MTVATEVTAERKLDIVAGVPISTAIPATSENDVQIYYGIDSFQAILNVDYTAALVPPFNTIRVTPLTLFIEKINNLIADNPDEINAITIRREKDYLTSATPDFAKSTRWVSSEFDATAMRFAQLAEQLNRALVLSPTFVGAQPLLQLLSAIPNALLAISEDGLNVVSGPSIDGLDASAAAAGAAAGATAGEIAAQLLVDGKLDKSANLGDLLNKLTARQNLELQNAKSFIAVVDDYGPTGTSDDGPTFQAALNAIKAAGGGTLCLLAKNYTIDTQASLDLSATAEGGQPFRFAIEGKGGAQITSSVDGAACLRVSGYPWGVAGYNVRFAMHGVAMRAIDNSIAGGMALLKLERVVGFEITNSLFGSMAIGLDLVDTLAGKISTTFFSYGAKGIRGFAGSGDPALGSSSNEIVLDDVHFTAIQHRCALLGKGVSQLVLIGGSTEGLGNAYTHAQAVTADVYGFELQEPGGYGGLALTMVGYHAESNNGKALFKIQGGVGPATYTFNMDHTNNGAAQYLENAIEYTKGVGTAKILLMTCVHDGVNGYAGNVSRPFYKELGSGGAVVCTDIMSQWNVAVEAPIWASTNAALASNSVIKGGASSASAGAVGLQAMESVHATSRRATVAVGSNWQLIQDVGQSGNKGLSFFNIAQGKAPIEMPEDNSVMYFNVPVMKPNGFVFGTPTIDLGGNSGGERFKALYVQYTSKQVLTVATLPTASGDMKTAFVSDSSVPAAGNFGAVVAGGGANRVPVYSDPGSGNWRIG